MAKKTCSVCGNECGFFNWSFELSEGFVCAKCLQETGKLGSIDVEELKKSSVEDILRMKDDFENSSKQIQSSQTTFQPTYEIDKLIKFDDVNQYLIASERRHIIYLPEHYKSVKYNQIRDFEYIEDGNTVKSSGVAGALAGGLLAGGLGFAIGALSRRGREKKFCKEMSVRIIYVEDDDYKFINIPFIDSSTKRGSSLYKHAQESAKKTLLKLQDIKSIKQDTPEQTDDKLDSVDELRKYKSLLDDGIITEDEFNLKKKEILGI